MAYILNWRDVQPKIAHMSAVHWGGFRDRERVDDPDERNRLEQLGGFARHALQGRKTSDHHQHDQLEQVYYILSGTGEVLYGDERFPVRDGDAIYLPAGVHHQMFNDMNESWLEHHVISQPVAGPGGEFVICNWRQVAPEGDGVDPCVGASWHEGGMAKRETCARCWPLNAKPCSRAGKRACAARRLNKCITCSKTGGCSTAMTRSNP